MAAIEVALSRSAAFVGTKHARFREFFPTPRKVKDQVCGSHLSFTAMPSFDFRRFGEAPEYGAPDDNIDYGLFDIGGVDIGPRSHPRGIPGRLRCEPTSPVGNTGQCDCCICCTMPATFHDRCGDQLPEAIGKKHGCGLIRFAQEHNKLLATEAATLSVVRMPALMICPIVLITSGDDAGGPATPVVSAENSSFDAKGVHHRQQVRAQGRLFTRTWRRRR
ncbi:hypothetical protein FHX14_006384 [Rhizobium sp. BK619]|nr:hypothetical protein [Rhizobium sp. BK619]